jgi:hypothetical protein
LVGHYEQLKSLPIRGHGSWPFLTKINATVAYSLGIECVITSWKANETYYKSAKFEPLKVYTIDAMMDQRFYL